jgi:hypothetical protein
MGLLGEMITRTYHESQAKAIYAIREIVSADAPKHDPSANGPSSTDSSDV